MIPYILCLALLAVGIYAMIAKKNVIKIILGLMIAEYAVNLLLVTVGYRHGGHVPIMLSGSQTPAQFAAGSVDPLAQAVVLVSMITSLSVLLVSVALAVRIYQKYGTFDITEIRKLKG